MFYSIPRTRMLSAAQNSLSPDAPRRGILFDLLIFWVVTTVSSIPQSLMISIVVAILMMQDYSFSELISQYASSYSFDAEALIDYMEDFTARHSNQIMLVTLFASGFLILGAIIYCKRFENRRLLTLGFIKRGFVTEYLLGLGIGAVMIAVPALVCHLTGCVTLTLNTGVSPAYLALFFAAFVLQGMGEEAIFRGYLLTSLCRRNREWVAITVSAITFALFHGSNQGFSIIAFANITLFGIFAALFMLKRGSIWAVAAIHTVWNFMQGNIFGFSVSGNPTIETVFFANSTGIGAVLSGGSFGLEGGLGATVILLAAILLTLMMPAKRCELTDSDSVSDNEK